MAKHADDFADAVLRVGEGKRRAAQARLAGANTALEPPGDVYRAACQQIAASLEADGFRYAKTRQTLTRTSDEWKFYILFQSDRNNVRGERIGIWVHAHVHNSRLLEWRTSRDLRLDVSIEGARYVNSGRNDHFAGGQIGNLVEPCSWFDWNLAAPDQRSEVIDEILVDLRRIALPYFQQCELADVLKTRVMEGAVSSLSLSSAVEFLLCYYDPATAAEYLEKFLDRRPEFRAEVNWSLDKARTRGRPIPAGNYAGAIAHLVFTYQLPFAARPPS